jgi:dolichyl-phosphate beta-glucosyltransferase
MWPVTAAVGPIAAFNLTLILAPPASAWATFVAARRLTGQFWPALFAGPVFGFCDYEMSHEASGQPNLSVTLLLPLIVYLVIRWWEGSLSRRAFLIWTTLALATEFYTFLEAFADLTMVAVIALVIGYVAVGRDLRPKVFRLAVDGTIAYAAAIVLAAPYLYEALKNYGTSSFTRSGKQFYVDIASVVLPRAHPDRLLGMTWWAAAAGHFDTPKIYVGIPLLLLFALVAIFMWKNRLVRLLVPLYVVIFLLSLGPTLINESNPIVPLPWGWIWSLPFLHSAIPARLMDFGQLVLAIVLALWLAQATKSKLVRAARWALAVVSVAAIFANLPTFASVVIPPKPTPKQWVRAYPSLPITNYIPTFFTDGIYKKYIKPGEQVVVISHRGNAGMMFQSYTDFYFRVQGGFINASLTPNTAALPAPVDVLSYPMPGRAAAFRAYAKRTHLGAIIVERAWSEQWMYIFGKMGYKTTTVGGVTIYQLQSH